MNTMSKKNSYVLLYNVKSNFYIPLFYFSILNALIVENELCFAFYLYKFSPLMRKHKILRVWEKHLKILELLLLSFQLTSITVLKVSLWMDSRKFETIRWDIYVAFPFFFYFFLIVLQWWNVINESSTFFGFKGSKEIFYPI